MRVLILCTGNSCRSPMAAAFVRRQKPEWQVYSAGTFPAREVHPMAVRVMAEVGIDISHQRPTSVEKYISQSFDYVITVCDEARESCPAFIGEVNHRLHMGFPDPAQAVGEEGEVIGVFRRVRDEIEAAFAEIAGSIGKR